MFDINLLLTLVRLVFIIKYKKKWCLNTYFCYEKVNFRVKLNIKSNIYSNLISHFVREKVIRAKSGGQISIHGHARSGLSAQIRHDPDNILLKQLGRYFDFFSFNIYLRPQR